MDHRALESQQWLEYLPDSVATKLKKSMLLMFAQEISSLTKLKTLCL